MRRLRFPARVPHTTRSLQPEAGASFDVLSAPLLDQWVLLEADLDVIVFCERRGYSLYGGRR
jgi:primosomal protein N'